VALLFQLGVVLMAAFVVAVARTAKPAPAAATVADNADRVWTSVKSLYIQLIDQASWLYVVPSGAALALVCLFMARLRSIATFYLATGLISFVALVWVYWISPTEPLSNFFATSTYRVVAVLAAIAFAALLQLASSARDA
jgi:hypothetical protein